MALHPAFTYSLRGPMLEPENDRKASQVDIRDQELEQYLWTPYQHHSELTQTVDIPVGVGDTILTFDQVEYDPESMQTAPSILTTKIVGIWAFNATLVFHPDADGNAYILLRKNGTKLYNMQGGPVFATGNSVLSAYRKIFMDYNDTIEVLFTTNITGTVLTGGDYESPSFQATYISSVKASGPLST